MTKRFVAWADGRFQMGEITAPCALGRSGVRPAADKREGDGASPAGVWPIRRLLYRPDRAPAPETRLPTTAIAPDDGWCDAPDDAAYNQPVRLPYPARCEALWRDDGVYDLIVVLGHNDNPVAADMGSAIFLHLARPDYSPTEGCIAVSRADMEVFLGQAAPGDMLEIRAAERITP